MLQVDKDFRRAGDTSLGSVRQEDARLGPELFLTFTIQNRNVGVTALLFSLCDSWARIRGKSEEKNLDFAASEASDMAQRSSDGINADGELTPSTRKTALEAMRNVLQRTEFTPRALAEEDGFGMEAQGEDDVAWSFSGI